MPIAIGMPTQGTALDALGNHMTIVIPKAATNGLCSVVDFEVAAGFKAPPFLHSHRETDWHGVVTAGSILLEAAGKQHLVPTGGVAFIPRGVAFRWQNASETEKARWILTYTPGGFEEYFVDLVAAMGNLGRPVQPQDLATLAPPLWAKHGVEVVHGQR